MEYDLKAKVQDGYEEEIKESPSFLSKLRVMERMVVQNATMGITMDYRYWDDPADQYQEEGISIGTRGSNWNSLFVQAHYYLCGNSVLRLHTGKRSPRCVGTLGIWIICESVHPRDFYKTMQP